MSKSLYYDYNAGAPLRPEALKAMQGALAHTGNPSSIHSFGRKAKSRIEKARDQISHYLSINRDHLIFTSGATEAANTLLTPYWQNGRQTKTFKHLILSSIEHPCVDKGGFFEEEEIHRIQVSSGGIVNLEQLDAILKALGEDAADTLVSIMAANNETGVKQPLKEIIEICKNHKATIVIDAVQWVAHDVFDEALNEADAYFISAHKCGGPQGVGAIILKDDMLRPLPLLTGGAQEKYRRAGTHNVSAIAGFGAAIEAMRDTQKGGRGTIKALRDTFEKNLLKATPNAVIFGYEEERLSNTTLVSVEGLKAEMALIAFDLEGIALSSGSACSSGKIGKSHVLQAMGVKSHLIEGALRISIGWASTKEEIDYISEKWCSITKHLIKNKPKQDQDAA